MNLDRENGVKMPSCVGLICSMLMYALIFGYAYYKVDIMLNMKNVNMAETVYEKYFDEQDSFGAGQGLSLAIANPGLEPKYGRIVFRMFRKCLKLEDEAAKAACIEKGRL